MRKKRILVITPSLNHYGGGSNVLFKTIKNLEDEFDFKVLVPKRCELLDYLKKNKVDTSVYQPKEKKGDIKYLIDIIKSMMMLKTDILFFQDYTYWKPAEILAAKFLGIPVVSEIHGDDPSKFDLKSFLQLSDKIISVSKFRAAALLNSRHKNKVAIIHNFEDTKKLDKGKKMKGYTGLNIGFVGRIRRKKGVMTLLKSARLLKDEKINFLIFGSGDGASDDCTKEAKEFIKKNRLDKVHLKGFIDKDKLADTYKSIDVLTVPSLFNDSFPCTVIEAMAAGVPVIASKVGGIPEQIEHMKTGILVEKGNYEDIAENIMLLKKDKKLKEEISRNAKKKAQEEYDEKKQTEKYKKIFRSVL